MTICLGVDPGLTGAITFLDRDGLKSVYDLPTMLIDSAGPKATIKREIDVCALKAIILANVPADEKAICFLEHVSSLGTEVRGDQAKMSLAATKASIVAVVRLLGIDLKRVTPQAWKRFYGLSSDKGAALAIVHQFWPHYEMFKRAKDHNRAESALIARYGQRTMT